MHTNRPEVSPDKCVPQETYISDVKLAHAYVPFQKLCSTFTLLDALKKGTAFPPLYEVYAWNSRRNEDYDDE